MYKKSKIFSILLSVLLATSIAAAALPLAGAHSPPWTVPNFTYIMVSPTTVGVGQHVLVIFWANTNPPTAYGSQGDRWNFFIDITKPDGSKETVGPIMSDPIGGGYYSFTPDKIGTYSFVARFPAQVLTGLPGYIGTPTVPIPNAYVNDTYGPSQSRVEYLTVQQSQVVGYLETPVTNGYWTRPVSGLNRYFYETMGNWLAWGPAQVNGPTSGQFAYGSGPESAHVLWARPVASGGIADERFGSIGYTNYHYDGLGFSPPIIIDGKLIYDEPQIPKFGQWVVDLYTGQTLYFRNSTGSVTGYTFGTGFDRTGTMSQGLFDYGWVYNAELPNQHGAYNYLIVTNTGVSGQWDIYDAMRGDYICSVANVSSSGTGVYGADGSYTFYSISGTGANQRLLCWNLTRAIWYKSNYGLYYPATERANEIPATTTSNTYWMWRPYMNYTFNGRNGYSINVSLAANSIGTGQTSIRAVREGQYIIGGSTGNNPPGGPLTQGVMWCMNLDPANGDIGKILWNRTFTPPSTAGNVTIALSEVSPEDDMFIFSNRQTLQYYGYSMSTMQQVWGPGTPELDGNYYGLQSWVYQGKLISTGYGGQVRAYDMKTGEILWNYNCTTIPFESPYGNNYPVNVGLIADGKIYVGTGEHSPTQPVWRGNVLQAIDADTGDLLWNFPCYGVSQPSGNAGNYFAAADGRLLALNAYDNMIYCFGTGPSATTVTAPNVGVPQGTPVMLTGTVTDQSPSGRLNVNYDLDVPLKGTPAISDADMSDWMQYLYQQRPMPTNAKGVPVHLTAIDPNNNFQDIGEVTSDINGNYGIAWTPPVPGAYMVTATFAGSRAYSGSSATTYFAVGEPTAAPAIVTPTPTPTATQPPVTPVSPTPIQTPVSPSPTQVPQPPTSDVPTETYIAIVAAVLVIVAVAAALVLRRRK